VIARALAAAAALLACPAAAGAGTLLSDGFEAGPAGGAADYRGFANFDVTGGGVDLLPAGGRCATACVELAATRGGGLVTKQFYAFRAGDLVALSFDLGGSGTTGSDFVRAGFEFDRAVGFTDFTRSGAYGSNPVAAGTSTSLFQTTAIESVAPLRTYRLSFRALTDGQLRAAISASTPAPTAPVLDNLRLDVGAVPEPSAWATVIGGLALIGAAMRRRRARTARFA